MTPKEEFQQTRAALVKTLMLEKDSNRLVEWRGQRLPVHEVLKDLLTGADQTGAVIENAPYNGPNGRAAGAGGASVTPSQEAIDALSPEHYAEMQRTGGLIEGFNTPMKPRVTVRDSNGSTRVRAWRDEVTGEIKTGSDDLQLGANFERPPGQRYWWDL